MFFEGPFVEQLEAEGAGEVLRVPLLAHCRDTLACRGRGRGKGGRREQRGRRTGEVLVLFKALTIILQQQDTSQDDL